MNPSDFLTLKQVNLKVSKALAETFYEPIWMTAEISEIRTTTQGHCYLEFIEKSSRSEHITARARGTIWAQRWWLVKETFERFTGQSLAAGMKILVCVEVEMHELYGYSLNVIDIDPGYTVGELARQRNEIIRQLTEDGIIDLNKELPLPTLPQRIAVISAAGAAGYGDFCAQLAGNEWGLVFYPHLFPAVMQGDKTEASIIQALDNIYRHCTNFDIVVIIRGGGATADLAAFDSYMLAAHCAQFPLPILVGIGHERDKTVLDLVAHTSLKTPTAVAAYLIELLSRQYERIRMFSEKLQRASLSLHREINRLSLIGERVALSAGNLISRQQNTLSNLKQQVYTTAQSRIETEKNKLKFVEKNVEMAQPDNILKRGFSITRLNGQAIKKISDLKPGYVIETQFATGSITSEIKSKSPKKRVNKSVHYF